eukprot:CAMPEP_0206254466 /NCGR_PEP_ID=MMETSP0047_2-20121206/23705_1 /ASSEMBLY_ACC=CAM_ASM_000192 /TAXON_ID=195065 /ORGANISM="Chroomonas mesostigmatica_cf, Strain CCMP1168" /LENGTH=244 /DNA_ID=CAMNT_0053680753 /DNA_START=50 /DNA_END=784 /DNA_ORIENTATION=-
MSLLHTPFSTLFMQTSFSAAPSADCTGNSGANLSAYWWDMTSPSQAAATETAAALDDSESFSADFGIPPAKSQPFHSDLIFSDLNAALSQHSAAKSKVSADHWDVWEGGDVSGDSFWASVSFEPACNDFLERGFTGPIPFTVEAHRGASVVHASYASPSSTPIPLLIKRLRSDEEAADRPSSKRQRGASTPPVQPCKYDGSSARTPPPPSLTPRAGSAFSSFQKRLSSSEGPQALACAEQRTSW